MLQGGMRIADLARAINCNIRTVRCLRQGYSETGWTADHPRSGRPLVTTPAQDRYIRTSHLRDRYRMATTTMRYREDILLPRVVPFLQARPDMTLQHDNATSHTAHSVLDFLQDKNVLASEERGS